MASADVAANNPLVAWNLGRAGGVDMPQWSKVTPEHGASSLPRRARRGEPGKLFHKNPVLFQPGSQGIVQGCKAPSIENLGLLSFAVKTSLTV